MSLSSKNYIVDTSHSRSNTIQNRSASQVSFESTRYTSNQFKPKQVSKINLETIKNSTLFDKSPNKIFDNFHI